MRYPYSSWLERSIRAQLRFCIVALLFQSFCLAAPALAQDDGGTSSAPEDPQVSILTLQKTIAELRAAIATAERSAFSQSLPSSGADVAALPGTTSVNDTVKTESRILARIAAVRIADVIASRVPDDAQVVVLNDPTLREAIAALAQFRLATDLLTDDYRGLPAHVDSVESLGTLGTESLAPGLAIDAASAFIKSAAGIAGLFRQNTVYTGQDVAISDAEFRAYVAAAFRSKKPKIAVIDPQVFFPGPVSGRNLSDSIVFTKLATLMTERRDIFRRLQTASRLKDDLAADAEEKKRKVDGLRARRAVAEAQLEELEKELRAVSPGHRPSPALLRKIDDTTKDRDAANLGLATAEPEAKAASDRYKKYQPRLDMLKDEWTRWLTAANGILAAVSLPTKDSAGLLGTLARTDALWFALSPDDAKPRGYILEAKVPAAGGTYRTRQNLWTTLFTGDLLSYSGGANGYFVYVATDGVIADAGEVHHMSGFGKFKKLVKEDDGSNADIPTSAPPAKELLRLPMRPSTRVDVNTIKP